MEVGTKRILKTTWREATLYMDICNKSFLKIKWEESSAQQWEKWVDDGLNVLTLNLVES